ncbi:MAG: 2-hydroxychromene-2-carboxylate isomerase [Pseudomonadota bacterium]
MPQHVQCYFDFISPYAYLGWHRAKRELGENGIALEPMPALFAAMLNANDTKGPAEIPAKRIYTWKHVIRLAADLGLPIQPPPAHPFNPLVSLRVVTALPNLEDRQRAVDAIYAACWQRGEAIQTQEEVAKALDTAGLPGERWVEAAGTDEVKTQLKNTTAEAINKGVFGVPSFVVGEEVFWGQDTVPHVAAYLRGEDPAKGAVERWRDLPAAVQRRGSA